MTFFDIDLFDEWNKLVESVSQSLLFEGKSQDTNNQAKIMLFSDFVLVLILGYIAGMYYTLLLYIPIYMFYLLFTLSRRCLRPWVLI